MRESTTDQKHDLEDRTFAFGEDVRSFARHFPRTLTSVDDLKQLVRSSGSVGANYVEARESMSKKDRVHKIKICRKEAKESRLWLRMLAKETPEHLEQGRRRLTQEARELELIFGAMVQNSKS